MHLAKLYIFFCVYPSHSNKCIRTGLQCNQHGAKQVFHIVTNVGWVLECCTKPASVIRWFLRFTITVLRKSNKTVLIYNNSSLIKWDGYGGAVIVLPQDGGERWQRRSNMILHLENLMNELEISYKLPPAQIDIKAGTIFTEDPLIPISHAVLWPLNKASPFAIGKIFSWRHFAHHISLFALCYQKQLRTMIALNT